MPLVSMSIQFYFDAFRQCDNTIHRLYHCTAWIPTPRSRRSRVPRASRAPCSNSTFSTSQYVGNPHEVSEMQDYGNVDFMVDLTSYGHW
jgi:hypothetical protein